jgi:hypothetical protein
MPTGSYFNSDGLTGSASYGSASYGSRVMFDEVDCDDQEV